MGSGASTPEELESQLEDALVIGDHTALGLTFDRGAVLVAGHDARKARGDRDIARLIRAMWDHGYRYFADPRRVLQAGDIALVVAEQALGVMRRGEDRCWRYAISVLNDDEFSTGDNAMTKLTGNTQQAATAVRTGEGEARWWFGQLAEIKATAVDTGGQFTIVEVTCAPGYEAPLHVHHREDEAFWILDGEVTLYVGEQTIEAAAGDYAFGPRDIPHRYAVGEAGCRMLFICTPGGFEALVRDMSVPATSRTLPPAIQQPPDLDRVKAIANKHGCELLV